MKKKSTIVLISLIKLLGSCQTGSSLASSFSQSSCLSSSVSSYDSTPSSSSSSPSSSSLSSSISSSSSEAASFIKAEGRRESAYMEWAKQEVDGYNVYYQLEGEESWTKIDSELIREYPSYYRADVVGLKAGKYLLKMIPIKDGRLMEDSSIVSPLLNVFSYARDGYAFKDVTSSGAYKEDGTLKDNAIVIYVSNDNINSLTGTLVLDSKGKTYTYTGIEDLFYPLKKGYETRPIDLRFIGNITNIPSGTSSISPNGDLLADLSNKFKGGMTLEGIGGDATLNGFGIRVKGALNLEVRNLGLMNTKSTEKDSISLQQDNDYIWIHNCDIFYGEAGKDADQAKGDGSMDCKNTNHVTMSYLHFFDSGKSSLLGMKDTAQANYYVTYDHNWFDHSDSRHPRARLYSAHVYNNYFDGNSKYGIGASLLSNIFAENNYFRNCKYPILTSRQGSDVLDDPEGEGTFSKEDGGTVKAFNNFMIGQKDYRPYTADNTSDFDAYEVKTREEQIPSTVLAKQGRHIYTNFDTDETLKDSVVSLTSVADVPTYVKANAGRIDGGDFSFEFTEADDIDYGVNQALKAKLEAYKGTLVSIGGHSI